jgi:VCBS repeat protein/HYDIN/CFA65/VesB family protein
VGDFNRDGKLDVATVDYCVSHCQILQGTVTILLGNGDGTFQPNGDLLTNGGVVALAVADLNGDGKLDLAVAESFSQYFGHAAIFLGNGDGTFQIETDYNTGIAPFAITVGDFNGDGKLDLATANFGFLEPQSGTVSVLSGNGDGTFQSPDNYPTGLTPQAIVAADFNRDGRLDLATACFNYSTADVMVQSSVTLSRSQITFPYTLVGTSSPPAKVKLTNIGGQTLNIGGVAITGTDKKDFVVESGCAKQLPPEASCELQVIFKPKNYRLRTAGLTVTDDSAGGRQTVEIQGSGTALSASPGSLDFGDQAVGTISASQAITLVNHGSMALQLYAIYITGANPDDFAQTHTCVRYLGVGSSCTINVRFTPKVVGARTATVNVFSNGGASPETVRLSGTGTPGADSQQSAR